jgi:hypothetical protein
MPSSSSHKSRRKTQSLSHTEWDRRLREDESAARAVIRVAKEVGGISSETAYRKLRYAREERRRGFGGGCHVSGVRARSRSPRAKPVRRRGSRRTTAPSRAGPDEPPDEPSDLDAETTP